MRAPLALLVWLVTLCGCAHPGGPEAAPVGMSTAPVMPTPAPEPTPPPTPALPPAPPADSTAELLPARLQIVTRLEVARLAAAFGGTAGLLELLPQRRALEPAQWERLLANSALIWFGVDLRQTDARGYPDRLLVLSGEFADQAGELVQPPATSDAPEPVWPEAFGTRHVVLGRQVWHGDARRAVTEPARRLQPWIGLGPDSASVGPSPAAFELWAMLDEPSVREWTGPFADAFLRPLVLRLEQLHALQLSVDPGPETTTLSLVLHPRDAGQLAELQLALQTMLDSIKSELVDPGPLALFGDPRAELDAGRVRVSWTLPTAVLIAQARAMLR